jgi:hypothetical protein
MTRLAMVVNGIISIDEKDIEFVALPNPSDAASLRALPGAESENSNCFFGRECSWNFHLCT